MTAAWFAFVLVVVLAVVGVAVAPWLHRDRVLRGKVRRRYLVFLPDGEVFDGVLTTWDAETFVFADVHARSSGVPVAAAPGELYVPRTRVSYLQRVMAEQPLLVVQDAPDEPQAPRAA